MRSPHVCALTGVPYRDLDNLTRSASTAHLIRRYVTANPGGGNRRHWPPGLVTRVMVAARAREAGAGDLVTMAALTLDGPPPPPAGWLVIPGGVRPHRPGRSPRPVGRIADYVTTDAALVATVARTARHLAAVDYDLDAMATASGVPPGVTLDDVLAGRFVPASWPTSTTYVPTRATA